MFTKYHQKSLIMIGAVMLVYVPLVNPRMQAEASEGATTSTVRTFLDPNAWLDTIKKNIALPDKDVFSLPGSKEMLQSVSPKLQEINRGVEEKTGVNLKKFSSWFLGTLKSLFQFLINLLGRTSRFLAQ